MFKKKKRIAGTIHVQCLKYVPGFYWENRLERTCRSAVNTRLDCTSELCVRRPHHARGSQSTLKGERRGEEWGEVPAFSDGNNIQPFYSSFLKIRFFKPQEESFVTLLLETVFDPCFKRLLHFHWSHHLWCFWFLSPLICPSAGISGRNSLIST